MTSDVDNAHPPEVGRPHGGQGAVRGATIILASKIIALGVSFGTIAIVARQLTPEDYGIVAMVTSVTALFLVFSDMGLSLVVVQRPQITPEQLSTLFWLNVAFGVLLGFVTAGLAPLLAWFYGEPRLIAIALLLAPMFPILTLGLQHQALLKRHMKFMRLAIVRLSGTTGGALVAIVLALTGFGYWALVWQLMAYVTTQTLVAFMAWRWVPGKPTRCQDLGSMLGFGGSLTAHGLVGYLAANVDKILLGRCWGPVVLGLYANAFNLMTRPIQLAAHSVGEAAVPAMSRAADTPGGMVAAYRRTFTLTCLLGLPACVVGILWADDVVLTLFGPRWVDAIRILQWLFVAAVPRMLIASTGWVYIATARPVRMLVWALIWSPLVIAAFVIGLPQGAIGVAVALATAYWIAIAPAFAYCFKGTEFRAAHVLKPAIAPLASAFVAAAVAMGVQHLVLPGLEAGVVRLIVRSALFAVIYGPLVVRFVPLAGEGFERLKRKLKSKRMDRAVLSGVDTINTHTTEVR